MSAAEILDGCHTHRLEYGATRPAISRSKTREKWGWLEDSPRRTHRAACVDDDGKVECVCSLAGQPR